MAVLNMRVRRRELVGTITMPQFGTENYLGKFSGTHLPIVTRPISGLAEGKSVNLVIGRAPNGSTMAMKLIDRNHASVAWFHGVVPDWKFERVPRGEEVIVSTDWPAAAPPN